VFWTGKGLLLFWSNVLVSFLSCFPLIFCSWTTRKKNAGILTTLAKDSGVLAVLHRKVDIIPVCSQLLAQRFDWLTKVSHVF